MAKCYGLYDKEKIIGFCAVIHQPHSLNKKIKRCSRIVILPDYQGIGLGTKFLNNIAEFYVKQNFDFSIVTSAKNMIYSLYRNKNWILQRYSVNKYSTKKIALTLIGQIYEVTARRHHFFIKNKCILLNRYPKYSII